MFPSRGKMFPEVKCRSKRVPPRSKMFPSRSKRSWKAIVRRRTTTGRGFYPMTDEDSDAIPLGRRPAGLDWAVAGAGTARSWPSSDFGGTKTTSNGEILAEGGVARPRRAVLEKSVPNSKRMGVPGAPGEAQT